MAHDLFDDFLEELQEKYKEDRAKIKKWAKAAGVVVTSSSTFQEFRDLIKHEEGYKEVPEETTRNVFESLHEKAKEQDENAEKNAKKNRKRFVELLQRTREVTASTTYDMAVKLLGSSMAWEAVDEQTRRQCFDIFVDQLRIQSEVGQMDDDGHSGDSEDRDHRRKRDKKTEREKPKKKRLRE